MKWKMYWLFGVMTMIMIVILLSSAFSRQQKADRPNILLIVSEDHGQHLSCYGDEVIKTPHLDQIAGNGFRFKNAYVTESVCSPSRSTILSGLYPHQTGLLGLTTFGFRYAMPVKTIYASLKEAGYRTGMIGKLHVLPESAFPIGYHPVTGPNYERKDLGRYAAYAGQFMRESDEPFFLMVNYPDAHWPFVNKMDGRPQHVITADKVKPFSYLACDNTTIRAYTTAMYNCMLRLDECVGELMNTLKASGKERNTLVIYLSDHGDEMARGKFDIYEAANKVPFLVSWPGKIKKGMVSDALVSTIDIVPTLLEVAGLPAAKELPGKSLMPLFKDPGQHFRQYLYTEKNVDQVDLYYPRRAVRDKKYKLIYSLLDSPTNIVAQRYLSASAGSPLGGSPTLQELETASPLVKKIYNAWLTPNKVQLYDLENDPWEFNDLSDNPQYAGVKERLLQAMYKWQKDTDDPLRFPGKLHMLTQEIDTINISKNRQWQYPHYLYGR
jgi:N-sulfoglucosamine sulfohydrolase